jgi:hypothetical protein
MGFYGVDVVNDLFSAMRELAERWEWLAKWGVVFSIEQTKLDLERRDA